MGVFPIVLRKKRSSIRSEEINLKEGRSRSNFPNLEENREESVWIWLAIKHKALSPEGEHPLGRALILLCCV